MRVLVRDLAAGEAYAIQFRARTNLEESEWSQVLRLTTSLDVLAPAAVLGLNVQVSGTSFVVTWDSVTTNTDGSALNDFKDYEVHILAGGEDETYYVTQPRFDLPIEVNQGAFGTPEPVVEFRVRARDTNYNAVPTYTIATGTNPAPAAPANFAGQPGVNSINFTWSSVADTDLKVYRIYKGADAGSINTKVYEGLSTNFTYSSTNFETSEHFRVAAVDVFDQETFSANTVVAAPVTFDAGDVTPPAAPTFPVNWFTSETDLSNPRAIRANVVLDWDDNAESDLGSYIVQYKKSSDSVWSQVTVSGTATTPPASTVKINGLAHNTIYDFRIAARDKKGNVGPFASPSGSGTTVTDNTGPGVPTTPTASSYLGQLLVSWDGKAVGGVNMPTDFSHAEVHVSISSGFTPSATTYKTRIESANKAQQALVSGLDYEETYYVKLVAVDFSGNTSAASGQASTTILRVTGTDIEDGQVSTDKLADFAITNPKVMPGSLQADRLQIGGGHNLIVDPAFENSNIRDVRKANQTTQYWDFAADGAAYQGAGYYAYKVAEAGAASMKFNYVTNPSFEKSLLDWNQKVEFTPTKLNIERLGERTNLLHNGFFDLNVEGWVNVTWDNGKAKYVAGSSASTFRNMLQGDTSFNRVAVNEGETLYVSVTVTAAASNTAPVTISFGPNWRDNTQQLDGWPWTLVRMGEVAPGETKTLEITRQVPTGVTFADIHFYETETFVPNAVIYFDDVMLDRVVPGAGDATKALTVNGNYTIPGQKLGVYTDVKVLPNQPYTVSAYHRHASGPVADHELNLIGQYLDSSKNPIGTTRTNLATNPSFEVDLTGWTNYTNGTSTGATQAQAVTGSPLAGAGRGVLRLRATTLGATTNDRVGVYADIPAAPGDVFSISTALRVLAESVSNTHNIGIYTEFRDASTALGSTASTTEISTNQTRSTWLSRIGHTKAAAPAGTTTLRVYLWIRGTGTSATAERVDVDFDAVLVEKSASVGTYFDGSVAGAQWTGAVQGSTSTLPGNVQATTITPTAAWERSSRIMSNAPASAAYLRVTIEDRAEAAGDFASQFDQVMVEDGSVMTDYFDGSTAGGAWTGEPHESQSALETSLLDRALPLAASNFDTFAEAPFIDVTPDQEYYFSVLARTETISDNGALHLGYIWRKKDGTTGMTVAVGWKLPKVATAWERLGGKFNLDPNIVSICPFFSVTGNRQNHWRVQHPDFRPVVPGVLIQDGAITAGSAIIADAAIDDAKIGNVSAGKITTGELAVGQRIIAGPESGTHAEMTSTGFRAYKEDAIDGVPDEVVRIGTDTNDYFGITDTTGEILASIDDTGTANFQGLNSRYWPTIEGISLQDRINELIDPKPRGLISHATVSVNQNNITSEIGLLETNFRSTDGGRAVMIQVERLEVATANSATSPGKTSISIRYTTNGSAPTISSPILYSYHVVTTGGHWTSANFHSVWFPPGDSTIRLLLTASTGAGGYSHVTGLFGPIYVNIYDMGLSALNSGVATTGGGTTAPPRYQRYWEQADQWRQTYRGNGSIRTDTTDVVQGYNSSNGDGKGYFGWNTPTGDFAGATMDQFNLYMYSNHWYYNSGGTARIGYHGYTGAPGGWGGTNGRFDNSGWPKPGGKEITINGWLGVMQSGALRGIALGPGDGTNLAYYGRFSAGNTVGKVWYTK